MMFFVLFQRGYCLGEDFQCALSLSLSLPLSLSLVLLSHSRQNVISSGDPFGDLFLLFASSLGYVFQS